MSINPSNESNSSGTPNNDNTYGEATTGPLYWERRRAEWLAQNPNQSSNQSNTPTATEKAASARARLEALLAEPGAEEDELIWNDSINAIWKGLVRGDRLKKNLPLPVIVSIGRLNIPRHCWLWTTYSLFLLPRPAWYTTLLSI
jgi:hypothetical protein